MIHPDELTRHITEVHPDAEVTVTDLTGTSDHLRVVVTTDDFDGVNLMNRQRMVYKALAEPMGDGRIHALEINARTHAEAAGK
ncbi:MAG: BolA/IbaG family iron-sulfur metabolism protein [Leptospirillia bacterium]